MHLPFFNRGPHLRRNYRGRDGANLQRFHQCKMFLLLLAVNCKMSQNATRAVQRVVKPCLDCQSACKREREREREKEREKKKERFSIFFGGKSCSQSDRKNARAHVTETDGVIDELFTGKKSTHRSKFRKIITVQSVEKESIHPTSRIPQCNC